tara:strand:- start:1069 stop:1362 length:294 start_codon:yes stop_codon:yes gene_type:complete
MERQGYSGISITSLVVSILGTIFFLLVWITAAAAAADEVVGAMAVIQFFMNLVGFSTGVASLFSQSKKRVLGILGTILSVATFIITLSAILIGLAIM